MTNQAIEIKNLSKQYGAGNIALHDLSLEIPKGSFFCLLGPNGAGKSTIINIIAGLVKKTSGKIKILGVDIDQDPYMAKSLLGIVPQEINLDVYIPIKDMLKTYAGFYGKNVSYSYIMDILSDLGLQDKANETSRALSGGMKRRMLIAKAIIHKPKVLILDEPSAGVDIKLRDSIWEYCKKLNKDGVTIILTTHYMEEAENLCNKVAFINRGEIIRCGDMDSLLKQYGSKKIHIEFKEKCDIFNKLKPLSEHISQDSEKSISLVLDDTKLPEVISAMNEFSKYIKAFWSSRPKLEDIFKNVIS